MKNILQKRDIFSNKLQISQKMIKLRKMPNFQQNGKFSKTKAKFSNKNGKFSKKITIFKMQSFQKNTICIQKIF